MELAVDILKPDKSPHVSYVRNDRMAGSVPVWNAANASIEPKFDTVLSSYQPQEAHSEIESFASALPSDNQEKGRFGFADIIDMVNPLQHIPLVNIAYRKITGDDIKPISAIVGGGVYGGAVGAASGLVELVVSKEDVFNYVRNMRTHERKVDYNVEHVAYADLPVHLLSLAEIPISASSEESEQKQGERRVANFVDDRTAGTIAVYS